MSELPAFNVPDVETIGELTVEDRLALARLALASLPDENVVSDITAEGMRRLKPGIQPFSVFKELVRITVLPTYEFAAIQPHEEGGFELALKERLSSGNQDWWEGKWHVPGTVMLASDEWPDDEADLSVFRSRLLTNEFANAVSVVGQPLSLPPALRQGARGKEVTLREMALVAPVPGAELPDTTRFFDARNVLANPPGNGFVETHEHLIQTVAAHYSQLIERQAD